LGGVLSEIADFNRLLPSSRRPDTILKLPKEMGFGKYPPRINLKLVKFGDAEKTAYSYRIARVQRDGCFFARSSPK
jgi:hypothetical protein